MKSEPLSDEVLLSRIGENDEAALRTLYSRYAALVFSIATRIVPADAAEDVVQEVFLTLWRKHETFDASRGSFKSWVAKMAKNRALNEQRRRKTEPIESDDALTNLADDSTAIDETRWLEHRRKILQAAVDSLPAEQRRAVSLAFFDELAHAEVASVLGAPVGTIKTRIRLGLKRLAPLVAALIAAVFFAVWRHEAASRAREERALEMVTASDVVPLHLIAQSNEPTDEHGSYRARAGVNVAVLTTSNLRTLGGTDHYVGWARRGDAWVSFGTLEIRGDGRSVSIAESDLLAAQPDEVRVTVEANESPAPTGRVVLSWMPAPH